MALNPHSPPGTGRVWTDGRGRIVRLTAQGERLQHATHQISRELEADWSAEIGEKRITSLKKTLEDMIATSHHKP